MTHFVRDLLVAVVGGLIYAFGKPKADQLGGYLFLAGCIAALLQGP
jgi:hypothetical protein